MGPGRRGSFHRPRPPTCPWRCRDLWFQPQTEKAPQSIQEYQLDSHNCVNPEGEASAMDSQWQLGLTADLINKDSLAAASDLVCVTAFWRTISSIA